MNRFFTLLFAASCLTAVGQTDYVPDSVLIDEGWSLVLDREGQQYWLFDEDREWEDARAMCEELGAYLYWPNSLEEHLDIWNSVSQGSNDEIQYWTAIHQDFSVVDCSNTNGGWAGPNGELQTFFLWRSDEPTNGGNGESVVQFEWGTDGAEWNDAPGQFCDGESLCTCSFSRVIMERSGFPGCTNPTACNYNEAALVDDNSCELFTCKCLDGTIWSAELGGCISTNTADINNDGCVQLNDLLDLLSAYGDCGAEESPWQCGDPLDYQGYDYETVQIGEQCWFSENCRHLPEVSPSSEGSETAPYYYVYGYEGSTVAEAKATDSFEAFGVLYNWPAVMTEGICPTGWHTPSDEDWQTMEISLGMNESEAALIGWRGSPVGEDIKSSSGWNGGGNGSNSSGFNGLPVGARYNGDFDYNGGIGFWWSSSASSSDSWRRELYYNRSSVYRNYDNLNLGYGFSARCVRDAE